MSRTNRQDFRTLRTDRKLLDALLRREELEGILDLDAPAANDVTLRPQGRVIFLSEIDLPDRNSASPRPPTDPRATQTAATSHPNLQPQPTTR